MSAEVSNPDTPLTVRVATLEDADQLESLMASEAETGLRFAPHLHPTADYPWRGLVARKLASSRTQMLVAESGERLVGYVELRTPGQQRDSPAGALARLRAWRKGIRTPSPVQIPPRAVIEGCFVIANSRRQGVGTALVETSLRWAHSRGIRRLELGVMTGNVGACSFWRSRGFSTFRELMFLAT